MDSTGFFGVASDVSTLMEKRKRLGAVWKVLFLLATVLAILFLILLVYSIIDSVFGYAVLRNEVEPNQLVSGRMTVEDFSRAELEEIAKTRLSAGILRRVESDEPIAERTDKDMVGLIEEYVVKPKVLKTYGLWDSIFNKNLVEQYVAENEGSYVTFRSWISPAFIVAIVSIFFSLYRGRNG